MKAQIGKNLKMWREKLGYSQEKLAEYLGISRENISYFENGDREIPVKHLEKLANLFGVEPMVLMEENPLASHAEMALAFRNGEDLSAESLNNIAQFKKIVRNYLLMESKLK